MCFINCKGSHSLKGQNFFSLRPPCNPHKRLGLRLTLTSSGFPSSHSLCLVSPCLIFFLLHWNLFICSHLHPHTHTQRDPWGTRLCFLHAHLSHFWPRMGPKGANTLTRAALENKNHLISADVISPLTLGLRVSIWLLSRCSFHSWHLPLSAMT